MLVQVSDIRRESKDLFSVNRLKPDAPSNDQFPAPPPLEEECESIESTNSNEGGDPATVAPRSDMMYPCYPVVYPSTPAHFFAFSPPSIPLWPGYGTEATKTEEAHEVLKPTAVHSKSPINVDELIGMSKLSLGESMGNIGPSALSLKPLEGSSRQSAFHANTASGGSKSGSSPVQAV